MTTYSIKHDDLFYKISFVLSYSILLQQFQHLLQLMSSPLFVTVVTLCLHRSIRRGCHEIQSSHHICIMSNSFNEFVFDSYGIVQTLIKRKKCLLQWIKYFNENIFSNQNNWNFNAQIMVSLNYLRIGELNYMHDMKNNIATTYLWTWKTFWF